MREREKVRVGEGVKKKQGARGGWKKKKGRMLATLKNIKPKREC